MSGAHAYGQDSRQGGGKDDVITDSDDRTPPAISAPAASSEYFTLEVCNRDRRKAFVSLSSRENPQSKEWYAAGWWSIAPGDCRTLGRYPKPTIYLHGEDVRGGQWRGRDIRLCVEKQRFKRVTYAGYKCSADLLRGYFLKRVTAERFVWNLNP